MAPPTPPNPVVLIDDLVEEFLLRLPPEDPAVLARATGGCNYELFKYDFLTNQISKIFVRLGPDVRMDRMDTVLIATQDGKLGVAKIRNSTIHLWVRKHAGRWEESRAIELHHALLDLQLEVFSTKPWLAGFADTGAGVIFLATHAGYFTVDLNSGRSKKVGQRLVLGGRIVPYVSFCTPAPGTVSVDEGLGAGVVVPTDEVPVAAVAVSYR